MIGLNRRRVMGGNSHININVKTHSTTGHSASLDVITGDGEPVNILFTSVSQIPWTNEYIQVKYNRSVFRWEISAITPCLYDGQVYKSGDLIATWSYTVIRDITIVANL